MSPPYEHARAATGKARTFLVTGAASGLGRSLALELSASGARLLLTDLREAALLETATLCRAAGALVQTVACDLTERGRLFSEVMALDASWHLPDVIIANAGLGGLNPGYAFSVELDRQTMAVNYDGMVNTLMPFVPAMVARGHGTLVGICSLAGLRGLPDTASYCASKAAQMTFLESLRVDLRPFGLRVCCVHLGFIRTPMTDHQEFPMPFMLTGQRAAQLSLRAIDQGRGQVYIPSVMGWLSRLNRILPNWLADWAGRRLAGRPDKTAKMFSAPAPQRSELPAAPPAGTSPD